MLRLCTAANLPEAHLLLHQLVHAGIEARVFNEHAQGGLGELPFTHTYPEIWIMEPAQEARAREILAEFERAPVSSFPKRCASCGETNPPAFEICWHCGKPLDRES
ncbi:MAG: hypothetical protein A3E57_05580 [Candidatus Muproteobacteria bacterium RIFCSPHIGHO2_12_FULL_60_33]|uniref:Uncharacterized protein n=1 Tax=Candidatus Muproteobacteria bacterium RIFCSPLOWO2_01_FULL_60_18 TaxID=1817768 RepID=A0A1F6TY14_9PROT|nr:MAG: hypothetical protein A3A87_01495 [Candidatus Muproteobacteria bacterium RIFCSPLOWO2_01_FULL_60_18]OGI54615.1 MAG: hypothetical protein A3E57_05580 [Candidatus Muproteobacteria bacterium RIFCSPHIGHO2_12_FULL_60_33]OGI58912.1 MAG: hypothetical protein A2809_01225 [Candidatus Muproteobacteria bacterium RIFCSPHIGHO2_01_FULL_61_200]